MFLRTNQANKRDVFIDSWRGIFHVLMVVDHLPFVLPGMFTLIAGVYEFFGYITAAEGFVFLSGYVSGLVYTRIGRKHSKSAVWSKALTRARNIYACYFISVIALLLLVKVFGSAQITWAAWNSLISEDIFTASVQVATLMKQPTFLEILPMYSILLLFTPILINQLERNRWRFILACSFLVWVAAQFNIRGVLLAYTHLNEVFHPGYFNIFAWQILFVVGLICGYKTCTTNQPWLNKEWRLSLAAGSVAMALFLLHHGLLGVNVCSWLIERSCLAPLRLINFFCIVFLICNGRRRVEKYIAWDGFAFLSKHSLQVFAFHLFPIYLAALLINNKPPLAIGTQLLVISFCIVSLFQIAYFTRLVCTPNLLTQTRRAWSYYFLLYSAIYILMLVEYFRAAPLSDPTLQNLRTICLELILSKDAQFYVIVSLFVWNLLIFLIKIHLHSQANLKQSNWWHFFTLRDKCKLTLIGLSFFVYVRSLPNIPQSGDSYSLLLGIDQSTNIMVFLAGLLISQVYEVRLMQFRGDRFKFSYRSLFFILLFLSIASVIHPDSYYQFKYLKQIRWSGIWVNPNTFGLLMGVGIVVAAGLANVQTVWPQKIKHFLCLTAVMLMIYGLLHSYSRGAWLATFSGLCYLFFQSAKTSSLTRKVILWTRLNSIPLATIICAMILLLFWKFHESEHGLARRLFSATNANDFSWRNRVLAWEGSLTMISDKPFFGFGWDMSEPMYNNYYQPAKSDSGMAIQLNDYFTIATTFGLPALVCFLWYVKNSFFKDLDGQNTPYKWLKKTSKSGVVVMLVGFWFDGGLFKLATATIFWILIELSTNESEQAKSAMHYETLPINR